MPPPRGDGLTDRQELAAGTNPFAISTTGDGVSDFLKVRQGRNPLGTAIPDTANLLDFQVFTRLH